MTIRFDSPPMHPTATEHSRVDEHHIFSISLSAEHFNLEGWRRQCHRFDYVRSARRNAGDNAILKRAARACNRSIAGDGAGLRPIGVSL